MRDPKDQHADTRGKVPGTRPWSEWMTIDGPRVYLYSVSLVTICRICSAYIELPVRVKMGVNLDKDAMDCVVPSPALGVLAGEHKGLSLFGLD